MRKVFQILTVSVALFAANCYAETVVVDTIRSDTSKNCVLKKIVEKIGNRLRALVIDREGKEQQIYIISEDAIEIKRGLWVIRPGTYQTEI